MAGFDAEAFREQLMADQTRAMEQLKADMAE